MMRAMCGVQLKDRKRARELMLSLNETIDRLAMANCVHCVLRMEDGHVLRMVMF